MLFNLVIYLAAGAGALALGWMLGSRRVTAAEVRAATAGERCRALEEQITRMQQDHLKALDGMRTEFKNMSLLSLRETFPELVKQAETAFGRFHETAKGDLDTRKEQITGILKPLEEQLKHYQTRLQQSEKDQNRTLGEVKQHLDSLAAQSKELAGETQKFRMVLHSNQARGRWGEETLRRVVEAAGMSTHCDFVEQTSGGGDDTRDARPDMIVSLPGGRKIIVDSKVPSLDFLAALDAADEPSRATLLKKHADGLRRTIQELARRDYPGKFDNTLDSVVLFVPAESLFSAALEADRDLIVWAASQKIMLATPASLIALLRSVSMSWQQHAQTENAREILSQAEEMFSRVATFFEHFENVQSGLEAAGKAFNRAVSSYNSRVVPQGERLRQLGLTLQAGKKLEGIEKVPDNFIIS